jgi:hypothetical protein
VETRRRVVVSMPVATPDAFIDLFVPSTPGATLPADLHMTVFHFGKPLDVQTELTLAGVKDVPLTALMSVAGEVGRLALESFDSSTVVTFVRAVIVGSGLLAAEVRPDVAFLRARASFMREVRKTSASIGVTDEIAHRCPSLRYGYSPEWLPHISFGSVDAMTKRTKFALRPEFIGGRAELKPAVVSNFP